MTWRFSLIGFIAAVVWPAAIAPAQSQDCNGNGVPDDIELAGKIYWTDRGLDRIHRANLNGTNVEELVTGLSNPVGIALDPAAGKMYWADSVADKIQRADLDGANVEDLVTGLSNPAHIALDPTAGKMYWTANDGCDSQIQRADLDGSNVEDLVVNFPFSSSGFSGIALDPTAGKMYWTDFHSQKIRRADLNGSNVEDVITMAESGPVGIALDLRAPVPIPVLNVWGVLLLVSCLLASAVARLRAS